MNFWADDGWAMQVYFTWVIRDFGSAEWFHSLLHAIEEQDTSNRIEINIYLTAKIKDDDMNNIIVQDVGAEKDAITSLRAPTHFGRPNWDRVFSSIAEKHPETDVGVFFCGPSVLSRQLHKMSNKYSTPKGTRFFFGKGGFYFIVYAEVGMLTIFHFCRELLNPSARLVLFQPTLTILTSSVSVPYPPSRYSLSHTPSLLCYSVSAAPFLRLDYYLPSPRVVLCVC